MGVETHLFLESPSEEFLCPICEDVLDDCVQVADCEHLFCKLCISNWIKVKSVCPLDMRDIRISDLVRPPKVLQSLLDRLIVICEKCSNHIQLQQLSNHECIQRQQSAVPTKSRSQSAVSTSSEILNSLVSQELRESELRKEIAQLRHQLTTISTAASNTFLRSVSEPTSTMSKLEQCCSVTLPKQISVDVNHNHRTINNNLVSPEHLDLIKKLRHDRVLVEERLYRVLEHLDFKNFFRRDPYDVR